MKRMPPTCPRCRRVHIYADVVPSGSRFVLHPESWRAAYDGAPSRGTRGQADQDMCDHATTAPITTGTTTTPITTKENR